MRIKIVSDGVGMHTKLIDNKGNEVPGIRSIKWECDVHTEVATATVKFVDIGIEADANTPIDVTALGDEYRCYVAGKGNAKAE